jgi:hypothetical protein
MMLSLNCLILGQPSEKGLTEDIGEIYTNDDNIEVEFSKFKVSHLKEKLFRRQIIKDIAQNSEYIDLWKVDSKKVDEEDVNLEKFTESEIKSKLGGKKMTPRFPLADYFKADEKIDTRGIHIFVVSTSTGKCLPMFYLSNKKFAVTKYRVWSDLFFFALKQVPPNKVFH